MAHAEADGTLSHLDHELVASLNDFEDPSQEWRRLFSELMGTFFLVLAAAGGGMMGQAFPNTVSRTAAVTAPARLPVAARARLHPGPAGGRHPRRPRAPADRQCLGRLRVQLPGPRLLVG